MKNWKREISRMKKRFESQKRQNPMVAETEERRKKIIILIKLIFKEVFLVIFQTVLKKLEATNLKITISPIR